MSAIEEIQALAPSAFEEIARITQVRPISVGVTKKGRALAFLVSLPAVPELPRPASLFGFPVVYGLPTSEPTLLGYGRRVSH